MIKTNLLGYVYWN